MKASYKYITYDPLKRKPDGICSRKMKNTFCLGSSLVQFDVCFDIWKFSYWKLWIIVAQNTTGTVPSAS